MEKRGSKENFLVNLRILIVLIVLFIFLSYLKPELTGFAVSEPSLKLYISEKQGLSSKFNGNFTLNLVNNVVSDTLVEAYIDDELKTSDTLVNLVNKSGIRYSLIEPGYSGNELVTINQFNLNSLMGIKLPVNADVKRFSVRFSGQNVNNLKVDVGDDNIIDWYYLGDFLGYGANYILPPTANPTSNGWVDNQGNLVILRLDDVAAQGEMEKLLDYFIKKDLKVVLGVMPAPEIL